MKPNHLTLTCLYTNKKCGRHLITCEQALHHWCFNKNVFCPRESTRPWATQADERAAKGIILLVSDSCFPRFLLVQKRASWSARSVLSQAQNAFVKFSHSKRSASMLYLLIKKSWFALICSSVKRMSLSMRISLVNRSRFQAFCWSCWA